MYLDFHDKVTNLYSLIECLKNSVDPSISPPQSCLPFLKENNCMNDGKWGKKNIRLWRGTKPNFMLMGSCQNLAHYLLVCSLTRSVGNLIIHCSSLSENIYSKCSIFALFIFPVEYQERNGIYPIRLWGYS